MGSEPEGRPRRPASGHPGRSAARLAAVQALFQVELTGQRPESVVAEFVEHRLGEEMEGIRLAEADRAWFAEVVAGTGARRGEIDTLICEILSKDWTLERLGAVVRAVLRAATYELTAHPEVPRRVVISEYVDVAHAFYEGGEVGFVNAALDRLARRLHPDAREEDSGGEGTASG